MAKSSVPQPSTSMPKRRKLAPFVGKPRYQETLRKRIVSDLLAYATDCRRNAARAERLAKKIPTVESLRDRSLILNLDRLEAPGVRVWIRNLFVEESERHGPNSEALFEFSPFGENLVHVPAPTSYSDDTPFDPVRAASDIVVGGPLEIDWSREPRSDRERQVRRALIERRIRTYGAMATIGLHCLLKGSSRGGSDIMKAIRVCREVYHEIRHQQQAREVGELQREILFGTATDEGDDDNRSPRERIAEAMRDIKDSIRPGDPDDIIRRIFG